METIKLHTDKFPVLSYRKHGKGQAIVLIHGFPEEGSLWDEVWPALSLEFTVIVPDLPGAGESIYSGTDISIDDMAESIKLILDSEQIDKVVLAGHSMGGYTAFAFADKYAERVAGLSAVHSFATPDDEEKKANRRKAIEIIKKGGKEAFVKQMVPGLFSKATKEEKAERVDAQIQQGMGLKPESMIAFYNAMIMREEKTSILDTAQFPLQWIIGKEDTVADEDKVLKQAIIASINFVSVYSNCAHMSMIEAPQQLTDDLTRFSKYSFSK